MRLIAALILLWLSSFAGMFPIAWTASATGDRDSCGAADVPLRDPVRTLLRVRDCGTYDTTYIVPSMPGDSMWANIVAPSGHVYYVTATAENAAGPSCRYMSLTFALPAVEDTFPPPPVPPDTSVTGITGKYYSGRSQNTWAGDWRDSTINFNWGLGSPHGLPVDEFSVQWVGKLVVPTAGAWTLYLEVDDGGQLYEGVPKATGLRIDRMGSQPLTEWSWSGNLIAGEHGLAVVFQAITGNAQIALKWAGPGVPKQVVPRSALR